MTTPRKAEGRRRSAAWLRGCDVVVLALALLDCGRSELALPPPAPRAIAPLSTSRVASQRPRFRWALPSGVRQSRLELCRDPACATVVHAFDTADDTFQIPQPLERGTWFWRVRSVAHGLTSEPSAAPWELFVEGRDVDVPAVTGGWMDFDRDGRIDFVAWRGDLRHSFLDVHLGRDGAPSSTPSAVIDGLDPTQEADGPYPTLDVNGDGFGDLLVPVPDESGSRRPAVLLGGPDGLSLARRWDVPIVTDGTIYENAVAVGDVDGDGYGDIVCDSAGGPSDRHLYVRIIRGGAQGFTASERILVPTANDEGSLTVPDESWFAVPPGVLGDIDADGLDDVLIATNSVHQGGLQCTIGRGYFWRGATSSIDSAVPTILTSADGWTLGGDARLGGAIDANSDGYPDVFVSACGTTRIGDFGAVAFDGSARGLPMEPSQRIGGAAFARDPSAVGDVNGDGFGDVVVIGITNGPSQTPLVFEGGPDGLRSTPDARLDVVANELRVFGIGDVDGDGFDDLAIIASPAPGPGSLLCRGGRGSVLACDTVLEGYVP